MTAITETPAQPAPLSASSSPVPGKAPSSSGSPTRILFSATTVTRQIYAGDFVTADAGTGLVHIAPGHGQDDYQLGMQHGLEILFAGR